MLAPKCATYNGRSTFANPKYLKIAQSKKPCLYEIPYDTSDHANRFCLNGEETTTLEKDRVNHSTSVIRPPLKSYQVKDKVVPNNSQVKFTKKENSRTSNVNVCIVLMWKNLVNSNHDARVYKILERHTTIQKPKSYFKELYENTNKAWKWWIEKKCPSKYKWTQTTPSGPGLKWKPIGRIFSNVRLSQDSYITIRVGITIPPSHGNAEDNSHKVVRLGINPMIQPEPEDLPKDNPKIEIAVLRRREKRSLNNNSFLGEYECSSLALDRRSDEKEEIRSLETRSKSVSDQEI
ncbi:hypothetical protein Tco_0801062 [Tanacetum coccineum]|uniref:Uncharacterized protein n=1 Tax=Tanacetum coccineum TaxID=301880 RepID=A0ABQ4ZUW4_9ASTR